MINIYNYHWIWYILGFIFAPRITLAVLFSVYVHVDLCWKILVWIIAILANKGEQ